MFEAPSILPKEASEAAEASGFRYLSDETGGIARLAKPEHFRYRDAHGTPVRGEKTLFLRSARMAAPGSAPFRRQFGHATSDRRILVTIPASANPVMPIGDSERDADLALASHQ